MIFYFPTATETTRLTTLDAHTSAVSADHQTLQTTEAVLSSSQAENWAQMTGIYLLLMFYYQIFHMFHHYRKISISLLMTCQ
jgi:hypothetical protein